MQISTDTEILETIFTHSTAAARLTDYLDNTIVADALIKPISEISLIVAGLLGKSHGLKTEGELTTQDGEPEFNVANAVDDLRQLVARADALANATESLFDEVSWIKNDGDSRRLERLAHLVGATSEAVGAAVEVGDWLAVELSTRRPEA